jgi:uncharacterized protein (DUF2336 family)
MNATPRTSTLRLDHTEMDRLLNGSSAKNRRETALHVSNLLVNHPLSPMEMAGALGIIDRLITDVEVSVRQAVAEQLKHCTFLPSDIALALAMDVEAVALPILRFSTVLEDDQLILVIKQGSIAKQVAISDRETLAASVSNALIDQGNAEPVTHLLANSGAEINELDLHRVVDLFIDDPAVIQALAGRDVPDSIETKIASVDLAGNLAEMVAEALVEYLVNAHGIPRELAQQVGGTGGERVLSDLISKETDLLKQGSLAERLFETKRLTPMLLLRSLCAGNLSFFETGMALLSGATESEARQLLYSDRPSDFVQIFEKSNLPRGLRNAFRIGTKAAAAERRAGAITNREQFTQKVMGQIIRGYRTISPGDAEHIFTELARESLDQMEDLAMAQL